MADTGDVVRRITISATGEGIDSTTNSVNDLGNAYDSASKKVSDGSAFNNAVLAVGGLGAATIGLMAGIRAFVDYAGHQSQALADIADHAAVASMSTKEYQQTLYAVMSKGVSEKDFTSGLDKIAADIAEASRGTTEFTKLLEANGKSINNNASEANKMKMALADIMTLMQNASPAVQQRIAQIVGVSASWIPFLKEGVAQFEAQKKAAADLGVVIDNSTINKAGEFADKWHTAVAGWDLQFKASLASILPLLIQAANIATTVIDGVGSAGRYYSGLLTPDSDKTTSQIGDKINQVYELTQLMDKLGEQSLRSTNLKGALGIPEDADIKRVQEYLGLLQQIYDQQSSRLRVSPNPGNNTTILSPNGNDADAITRQKDQIEKQIAINRAAAESFGESAAAQAGAKAEAELYAAAIKAGKTDLEQYADEFYTIRERVEAASQALNKAKLASDIKFASQTALFTPQDVAIANQLRSIYPNVTEALNSAEAAQLRFINDIKQVGDTARSSFNSLGTDILGNLRQGQTAWQAFENAGVNALTKISDKLLQMATDKLWQSAFGGSSAFSLSSLFGVGATSGSAASGAVGNPLQLSGLYADGTDDHPGGWSIVGEKGPELMNIPKGSQILPNGVMPDSGATHVHVPITIDARGADAAGLARVQSQLADLKSSLPTIVVSTVRNARQRRAL